MKKRIKFANGILDLNTMKLHTDGEYDFSVNYDYDPKAECPNFMQNMSEWMSDEDAEQVRKYLQSLINGERLDKCLFLFAGCGKTTFLSRISSVFGRKNMEYISNRPNVYDFHKTNGKLYVEMTTSGGSVFYNGSLKCYILGEPVVAKAKFARNDKAYHTVCPPLIIESSINSLDNTDDGLNRRFILIKFNEIHVSKKNTESHYSHCFEKAGIMNWIIG